MGFKITDILTHIPPLFVCMYINSIQDQRIVHISNILVEMK